MASTIDSRSRSVGRAAAVALMLLVSSASESAAGGPALRGKTVDFHYDASDVARPDWGWWGRAYLHPAVSSDPARPRPLVVFLHGVNRETARYYWMGGGAAPDVRTWMDELIDAGKIEPPVLAAPSTDQSCKLPQALFTGFDLDRFLAHTLRATRGQVTIDLSRIIVVGHSGAGCNLKGGIISALRSSIAPRAALVVDVCMDKLEAPGFARARPDTDVVVTWQSSWRRDVRSFERRLLESSSSRGARGLRLVREMVIDEPNPHSAILQRSLEQWLPRWLPAATGEGLASN